MRYCIITAAVIAFFAPAAAAYSSQFVDLEIEVFDQRFLHFIDRDARLEILADGFGWAEGPVWADSLDALLFSDVAGDRIYRWDEAAGLAPFVFPSGHAPDGGATAWRGANGLAIDASGALLLAQQGSRRLARMSAPLKNPAPAYQVLASEYDGKSINSPNDLVVHRSGDVYFTDPPYGLAGFENSPDLELDFFGVFRWSRNQGLSLISRNFEKPNGIALSSDQGTLYVSNSEAGKAQVFAIDLDRDGNALATRLFFDGAELLADGPGSTDGMALHRSNYLFVSVPNGFAILSPSGELLGKAALGQVTNLAFDKTFSYLYLTTPGRLLRLELERRE